MASRTYVSSPRSPTEPVPGKIGPAPITGRIRLTSQEPEEPVPAVEDDHTFRAPQDGDVRCPCPGLNTLANHGYLPRDGKNVTVANLLDAVRDPRAFRCSEPMSLVLAYGGFALMHYAPTPIASMDLHEMSVHGRIEHGASMAHKDCPIGHCHAPEMCDVELIKELLGDKTHIAPKDIARRRVVLEEATPIDLFHQEIARGEWSLVLGIFGERDADGKYTGNGVPSAVMRTLLEENRLPDGWTPPPEAQGLWRTHQTANLLRGLMHEYKEERKARPETPLEIAERERLHELLTEDWEPEKRLPPKRPRPESCEPDEDRPQKRQSQE